jgi:hypothetical protein
VVALIAWSIIGSAMVVLCILGAKEHSRSRAASPPPALRPRPRPARPARPPRLTGRGDILWVDLTGPGVIGLDCMVALPGRSRRPVMIPLHIAASGPRIPGLGTWMAGLVEQWARSGEPLSMELIDCWPLDARIKISKPATSVVLDVRNPLGIRSVLRQSLADVA